MVNKVIESLESKVSKNLVLSSIGPIASGKSTFLHSLHSSLKCTNPGIRIDKYRTRNIPVKQWIKIAKEREKLGIMRSSATEDPDKFRFYVKSDKELIGVDLLAPGGHTNLISPDIVSDGLFYFIDENFVYYSKNKIKCGLLMKKLGSGLYENLISNLLAYHSNLDFFGDKKYKISENIQKNKINSEVRDFINAWIDNWVIPQKWGYDPNYVLGLPYFGMPSRKNQIRLSLDDEIITLNFYRHELLGYITQSIIDSRTNILKEIKKEKPVALIIKRELSKEGNFFSDSKGIPYSKEEIVPIIENTTKKLLEQYQKYMGLHNQNVYLRDFKIIGNLSDYVHFEAIDSLSKKKEKIIETAGTLVNKVIEKKFGFLDSKLITFSKSKNEHTSYYEELL